MKYLKAAVIAFGMYSKIPMPRTEWDKESMKYVMCFFPWVGAVIGACFYLWGIVGKWIPVGESLYSVILTVIPVFLSGGIHMDGFLDTTDALSSWQTKERRLEILKDSHAGAFAVIGGCLYFLLYYGFVSELMVKDLGTVSISFFLSRCLSGYAVMAFPCAKNTGLAAAFAEGADKKRVQKILLIETILVAAVLLWSNFFAGGAVIVVSLLVFCWYHKMSVEQFGGITGDLAGWFLQVCELATLIAVTVTAKII